MLRIDCASTEIEERSYLRIFILNPARRSFGRFYSFAKNSTLCLSNEDRLKSQTMPMR